MKLLKLLSRYSLFRCSGRSLRRTQLGFAPVVGLASEVLEQRQLLSGNVTVTSAAVAGVGSLTLTNDSGDNDINVYRLDATHVEIDAFGGTTINGAASVVFALSKVTGITVNLGSGYDAYNIGSNPGDPALNIGLGGILFKGASGGGAGVDLQVFNASSNAMTILGSVTFQGQKRGSAYTETSSDPSYFYVYTYSGSSNLTIGGSISASETETSSGYFSNHVYTSDGNLKVNGSVSLAMSGGKGFDNDIFTNGSGSISIGLGVTESMTGSDGGGYNLLHAYNGSGIITVGLGVTQTVSGTGLDYYNGVISSDTGGTGSVKIGGSLRQTASTDHYAENQVFASGSGSMAIGAGILGGGVTQTMTTTGDGSGHNRIVTKGDGNITIGNKLLGVLGGSVVQVNTSADFVKNYIATYTGAGGITVAGSVTQSSASSGSDVDTENYIVTGDGGGIGNITIRGSVTINNTGTYYHANEILTRTSGSISIGGSVKFNDSNATSSAFNEIYTSSSGSISIALSVTISQMAASTAYYNGNYVYTDSSGSLTIGGVVAITTTENGSSSYNTENFVGSDGYSGAFSCLGIAFTVSGTQETANYVYSDVGSVSVGRLGVRITGSGSGYHDNEIDALSSPSSLTIAGSVVVIDAATGSGNQFLQIQGNVYIGGGLTVVMNGTDALININDGLEFGTVQVKGLFLATMLGTGALIVAGDSGDSGTSPVKFDSGVIVLGSSGAGATLEKESGVSALFVAPVFFTIVSS